MLSSLSPPAEGRGDSWTGNSLSLSLSPFSPFPVAAPRVSRINPIKEEKGIKERIEERFVRSVFKTCVPQTCRLAGLTTRSLRAMKTSLSSRAYLDDVTKSRYLLKKSGPSVYKGRKEFTSVLVKF